MAQQQHKKKHFLLIGNLNDERRRGRCSRRSCTHWRRAPWKVKVEIHCKLKTDVRHPECLVKYDAKKISYSTGFSSDWRKSSLIVLWAHDASAECEISFFYYAESQTCREICLLITLHCVPLSNWLLNPWPVLGGDDGEVDHLDRRPEKIIVEVNPWEPGSGRW